MEELTRWFDAEGKEIQKKPMNSNDMEFITEIGGELEESIVGINFYSFQLNKDEISELLGAKPSKAWNPNELHPFGNRGGSRMTNWGKWYLNSARDQNDINDKVKLLFDGLTKNLEHWKTLTSKYEVWVDIAGYINNWNRGFRLDQQSMKLLVDRNLEVVFDIYYEQPEGED
tara:strand:+ start:323 stop:838 length:516 start_codon:yes stop_codon:yes gene_type:complete